MFVYSYSFEFLSSSTLLWKTQAREATEHCWPQQFLPANTEYGFCDVLSRLAAFVIGNHGEAFLGVMPSVDLLLASRFRCFAVWSKIGEQDQLAHAIVSIWMRVGLQWLTADLPTEPQPTCGAADLQREEPTGPRIDAVMSSTVVPIRETGVEKVNLSLCMGSTSAHRFAIALGAVSRSGRRY